MGRRPVLVLVLFGLLAGGAAGGEPDIEKLVADLGGKDTTRRMAALNQLRNGKDERAIPLLLDAMDGFELFGRYYAHLVLESYPEKPAEAALRKVLQKDDPFLRLCAAAYFLRRGNDAYVDRIVAGLAAEGIDLNTRVYMVNRLYSLGDRRVREALHRLLVPGTATTLLGSVLMAMQHPELETDQAAVRDFLVRAEAADAKLMAAAFLYRFGDEVRKAELVEALQGGSVTSTGLFRMKSFLSSAGHVATEVLDAAADLLKTEDDVSVLRAVVDLLAEFRHRKALARIEPLIEHANAPLAKAAFEAVAVLGGGVDRDTLTALLEVEDASRRLAAADLLRRMDDLSGLETVVAILRGGTEAERREAAYSLGRYRARAAVDPLVAALMDADSLVRSRALWSLDQLLRSLFPYRRLDFVAAGYAAGDPAAQRKTAVEEIRAWWEGHRDGEW